MKRENVKEAMDKLVMGDGKEREERRERVRKLAEIGKRAIEEGGSSYLKMALFVEGYHAADKEANQVQHIKRNFVCALAV